MVSRQNTDVAIPTHINSFPSQTTSGTPQPRVATRIGVAENLGRFIHDLHVIVINRETGEILRELTINPDKDSQPRGLKPGPRPGHRKGGMPKGYKFPKK
jgi:hypothetical protein